MTENLVHTSAMTRQLVTIDIPELFDPNFLDVLLPLKPSVAKVDVSTPPTVPPSNPMIDALVSTATQTLTQNLAPAYNSTGDAVLDAFQLINSYSSSQVLNDLLQKAWTKDKDLTLRVIWNFRSIHDGKGQKDIFYRAFGWLLDNHPRTAIQNLPQIVNPVCSLKKDADPEASHGYWKDLLNVLGLATTEQLTSRESTFLNHPRHKTPSRGRGRRGRGRGGSDTPRAPPPDPATAAKNRFETLGQRLKEPEFKALYISVARLFTEQLTKDLTTLHRANKVADENEKFHVLKDVSLAAKWAPTPHCLHDKHTNISTAISLLLTHFQAPFDRLPSVLQTHPLESREVAIAMRQFFQKQILTPLREATHIVEVYMSSNRWKEIKYSRVPSVCMQNNVQNFYAHDSEALEAYLTDVEKGKKTISGATLMPHEIISEVLSASSEIEAGEDSKSVLTKVRSTLAHFELRVAETQWKTLVNRLKDAGTIENSIAVCDVSGSMGSINSPGDKKHPSPILPSISLSLLLAMLAKPPFSAGFITFSASPRFIQLNLDEPLAKILGDMSNADWGSNTDLIAVFTKLILPLAVKNKVSQEDMIKTVFIFTDMQFDAGAGTSNDPAQWATNYDAIKIAYEREGYEVPQIVYWDLAGHGTVDTKGDAEGVAMMSGFSPAMLKTFMGEKETEDNWVDVDEDGTAKVTQEKGEEFNPVNIMKKALLNKSFEGLVVVD